MISSKILLCVFLVAAWHETKSANIPYIRLAQLADDSVGLGTVNEENQEMESPIEIARGRVREGVPPPLCAGRCAAPRAGPVCAFDATGTARTFATLCELEAVSCRESTYYAITSLGEC